MDTPALSDPSVQTEAAQTLRSLIETVTADADDARTYADIVGDPAKIIDFARGD